MAQKLTTMKTRAFLQDGIFSVRTFINSRLKKKRVYLHLVYKTINAHLAAIDPFDFRTETMKNDRELALKLAKIATEDIGLSESREIFDFINNYFYCKRQGIDEVVKEKEQELQELYAKKEEYDRANRLLTYKS